VTPSRLMKAATLPVRPSVSTIEKAYVRGLKEGMRRGDAQRQKLLADQNELAIRLKTAKGELKRRALVAQDIGMLNEAESESLLAIMAETDRQNEEIGVFGPEVAEFNSRQGWIDLARKRGAPDLALETVHEAHHVTKKIRAWQAAQHKGG